MSDPIIQVRGLRKVYRVGDVDVEALRGVTLEVGRGEFLCVVGPSGSGKSTLFHILGGLTGATAGEVIVDGRDLSKISDAERTEMRKRLVGFVFQKYNLLPTLSAADNIAIARHIAGRDRIADPRFTEVLGLLGIGLGPVMWLLISEIYPTKIRGKAMSLATLSVWGSNWVVAVTFLTLLHRAGPAAHCMWLGRTGK